MTPDQIYPERETVREKRDGVRVGGGGVPWQHCSSNTHANKTNWARLKRGEERELRDGQKSQTDGWEERVQTERGGSETSCYSAACMKTETEFFTKIKLAYQQFDTLSDCNKTQYLPEEKLTLPLKEPKMSEHVTAWGKTNGTRQEAELFFCFFYNPRHYYYMCLFIYVSYHLYSSIP